MFVSESLRLCQVYRSLFRLIDLFSILCTEPRPHRDSRTSRFLNILAPRASQCHWAPALARQHLQCGHNPPEVPLDKRDISYHIIRFCYFHGTRLTNTKWALRKNVQHLCVVDDGRELANPRTMKNRLSYQAGNMISSVRGDFGKRLSQPERSRPCQPFQLLKPS